MLNFIVRRTMLALLTVWALSIISFVVSRHVLKCAIVRWFSTAAWSSYTSQNATLFGSVSSWITSKRWQPYS